MTLSYAGAQDFVNRIYFELRQEYRIPECFVSNDESAGDFGIAHFHGLTLDGCANLTFDNDRIPREYTVKHEIGHALSSMWNGGSSAGPMHEAFWVARGFAEAAKTNPAIPATAWEAQLLAIQKEQVLENSGYRFWPEEAFADTFGVVNTQYAFPITEQYGIWLDQAKMRDFYRALGEDMDKDAIKAAVVEALSDFGLDPNTFNFIKERLAKDAHHQHALNGTVTTEPVEQ